MHYWHSSSFNIVDSSVYKSFFFCCFLLDWFFRLFVSYSFYYYCFCWHCYIRKKSRIQVQNFSLKYIKNLTQTDNTRNLRGKYTERNNNFGNITFLMWGFICLSIYPSVSLSIRPSIYSSVNLSVCLLIWALSTWHIRIMTYSKANLPIKYREMSMSLRHFLNNKLHSTTPHHPFWPTLGLD